MFLNYHRHRSILLGLYPRDGRASVNIAMVNGAGPGAGSDPFLVEFVRPDGSRFQLDAEEISDGEYDARPLQEPRPLPAPQIEHRTNKVDTVHPLDRPRDVPQGFRSAWDNGSDFRGMDEMTKFVVMRLFQ